MVLLTTREARNGGNRKIAAILVSDVVGYSRLTGTDEDRILARLRTLRSDLIDPTIAVHNGRVVKRTGDGSLVEFRSVGDAVRCAIEMQDAMVERNAGMAADRRIEFRIGIHLGDVVEEPDGDLMGDSVNIAARIEGIAAPGAICLSEDAYRQVKGRLEVSVSDLGPKELRNIAEPVRVYLLHVGQRAPPRPTPAFESQTAPPRLSIVVLPFANISEDPAQEHFVDGVTESLTTDLSRVRGMVVIARNTAFAYKGKPIDAKTIGRELNVRYVLEGSVQRSGGRMRVNVQLIDAEAGHHLWAERFDKPVVDLFDMQDEIVARLTGPLSAPLIAAEARRANQAANPDALDLYFQGAAWLYKGPTPDNLAQARQFFERALVADPSNVDALIGSAATHAVAAMSLVADPLAAFAAAEPRLNTALSLAPNDARGHMWLGLVDMWTRRTAQGIARCEHALELDRNLAQAHALIGYGKLFVGNAEETESHIAEALRLSPQDPAAYTWMSFVGMSKNYPGSYEQAAAWFRRSIEANPNFPHTHFHLASALAHLGRLDQAHSALKVGLALNPTYAISRDRAIWTSVSDHPTFLVRLELLLDGLRKAGAPE